MQVYDERADEFAARHRAAAPASLERLYRTNGSFFHPGAPSADIGCGSGRDTAWLEAHGYPAVGYDATEPMLAQARARYAEIPFIRSALPDLDGVGEEAYANVLCSAVLMHL